jgi:hypothetical protein
LSAITLLAAVAAAGVAGLAIGTIRLSMQADRRTP